MAEDDTFTYHVKQPRREPANTATQSLITKERTQKLDLLIHLLSNLTQSLVVCGPKGIGKTTLLSVLQQRKTESWRYCFVQGNTDLSFEAVLAQLAKAQSLSTSPSTALRTGLAVALIIDNAGELVPGLITAIIQYAAANSELRVIFALTHDELQVKRGSDRAVDDCHIVEIPPLSERQSGDFLQHLSANPAFNLSFKAIGENMIAHIYRKTHGVPGRIIAEVSALSEVKAVGKLKWMVALAVVMAIAITAGIQWLTSSAIAPGNRSLRYSISSIRGVVPPASKSSENKDKEVVVPASIEQKAANVDLSTPSSASQSVLPIPTAPIQNVGQGIDPSPKELTQSVPANAKELLEPRVNANISSGDQQVATAAVKAEAAIKQLEKPFNGVQQEIHEPLFGKQAELSKAEQLIPENVEIKAQSEPVSAVDQKQSNKQADAAQQEIAAQLSVGQEKLKLRQAGAGELINSVEALTANKPETIQVPQKPVTVVAVPFRAQALVPTANAFTLQLMVLSKQSSINDTIKKYPAMRSGFRTFTTVVNGQQRFVLEYGSYPDIATANKAKQSLSPEFRNAMARKIHR